VAGLDRQADLLGAQIMARAGYDPRALAHMFETIAKESKGGGGNPQWLSSHPDPGNRTVYITKEAEALTIAAPADASEFQSIKAAFAALPPGKSMSASGKGGGESEAEPPSVGTPGQPVPKPSSQYREIKGGKILQASVPAEWTDLAAKTSMKVVPQNGYGQLNGHTAWTHGIEFGITKASSRDLGEATNAWLSAVAQNNPELKMEGSQQSIRIAQRSGLATSLVNPSPLGGRERIGLYTTFLADGSLFYYLTVVPENEAAAFQDTFRRIGESIRLTETR
jgi:hypothetical protein